MNFQPVSLNKNGLPGLEEQAWALFEFSAADRMFVYRISEPGAPFDPLVALGPLSLQEKQFFWASQFDPTTDPLSTFLKSDPSGTTISHETVTTELPGSILIKLRAQNWVVYPLTNHRNMLGLVLLGWLTASPVPTELQTRVSRLITRSMALEIDSARLYEQTHQQMQQAVIAQEITHAILRRDDLQDILRFIANEGMRSVDALGCSICLLEGVGGLNMAVQVGQEIPSPLAGISVEELSQRQEPQIFRIDDDEEPLLLLVIPLLSGQQTIGFLEMAQIESYAQPKDVAAARSFASQAAVAVELAGLYHRLQITAVAEERARLARDLHDSISQSLYAMTLYTRAAQRQLSEGNLNSVEKHLKELTSTSREALGEMRLLIYELRPMALERYGLKGILEQRLQSVEARSGLEIHPEFHLPTALPVKIEENLYHIALEALNNTIKHAQANRVWLSLKQADGIVHLTVQDDGAGFDLAGATGGLGLKTIQERAESMNGKLTIKTQPGEGVTISVEVPYG